MPCAIMIVGNEILSGFTLDTNSFWICQRLHLLGYEVGKILKVRDSVSEIAESLKYLVEGDHDIVFVVGGLGPTPDDMTYEGVALGLGLPVEENEQALGRIIESYEEHVKRGQLASFRMTEGVRKMACLPAGSILLKNSVGRAPGLLLEREGKRIFVLPGVPEEMKAIFTEEMEGVSLEQRKNPFVCEIVVKIEEARLFDVLSMMEARFRNVSLGSYPNLCRHEVRLRLIGKKEDVLRAEEELKDMLKIAGFL